MSLFSQQEIELIQSSAAEAEKNKRLSKQVLEVLYQHKILKLFIPSELGGRAESLPQALRVFDDCAFIDGTIGWLAAIGSGGNYFAGYYSEDVASRLFSASNAVLAGSGHSGVAKKTDGGYTVSGLWKYCSGAGFATFFTATAADENGTIKAYTFMPEQVTISNDWDAFGLKATESNTISVTNAFVPNDLVFDLSQPPVSFKNEGVYSFDFMLFARFSFAAVVLGLSRAFLQEAEKQSQYFKGNAARWTFLSSLLKKEKKQLELLAQNFYANAQKTWDEHNKAGVNTTLIGEATEAVFALSNNVSTLAGVLFSHLGMAVAMEGTTLNRVYRNLLTANQHMLLRKY